MPSLVRLAGDESFAEGGFVPLLKLDTAQECFPGLTEVQRKCKDVSHVAPPGLSVKWSLEGGSALLKQGN